MNHQSSLDVLEREIETLAIDTGRGESVDKLARDWVKSSATDVMDKDRIETIREIGAQLLHDIKQDEKSTIVSKNKALFSTLKSSLTTYMKSIQDASDPMTQSMAASLILKMNQVYNKNYVGTHGKKKRRDRKPPRIPSRKTKNRSRERSPLSPIKESG